MGRAEQTPTDRPRAPLRGAPHRAAAGLAAALCLLVCLQASPGVGARSFNDYRTLLVSRHGRRGASGNGDSVSPSTSVDGRLIAFSSMASNLGPRAAPAEVYQRNVGSGRTRLVSRADGAGGAAANGSATSPSSSASGRYVAFASDAGNLGGRPGVENIYVRDVNKGETFLVSRAGNGAPANQDSFAPSISADGTKVAFASNATNLAGGAQRVTNVYVRNLNANSTDLVSRASGAGSVGANANATDPAIAANGNAVAFSSPASNLGASGGIAQVFERRLASQSTILVSRAPGAGGAPADASAGSPSLDRNGGRVAFDSAATNLSSLARPVENVYLRDLGSNATILASRSGGRKGASGDRDSLLPDLPRDGRFVCFQSIATNLGNPYDGFGVDKRVQNVYVHDTLRHGTFLISRETGRKARGANGNSANVSCSAGASFAAFQSAATNLSRAARRGRFNIYRRTIFGGR